MRTLGGIKIPDLINAALIARFGREYTMEHIIVWLLEREAERCLR